jgi:hypothetical protein
MIFLIHYLRNKNETISFKDYADDDFEEAQRDRLALELTFNTGDATREIVLLEAPTREQLKLTHAKYFENGLEDSIKIAFAAHQQ